MKLFFRRQAIYYKNHIDAFPFILTVLALIVFTLAIYVFTPLDIKLTHARWPWAQGEADPEAPLAMIQFFACLASILNVLAIMNFRSTRKVMYAVVFYVFSAVQIVNDVYYILEVNRHISSGWLESGYPASSGLLFSYLHLVLLILSVILLALSPLIQKYTSKIKLKPVSSQDKDLN